VLPKLWILKKETKKRKKVMGEVEKSKKRGERGEVTKKSMINLTHFDF